MSRDVNERGPRVFAGQALTQRLGVVAGLVADSIALPHGGDTIGHPPGQPRDGSENFVSEMARRYDGHHRAAVKRY